MKAFVVLTLCVSAILAEDACYKDVVDACTTTNKKQKEDFNCSAKYGAIEELLPDLQQLANHHVIRSFEYLLMSTHFGNYEKNRPGFEKLFRQFSDDKWHEGIEMIKYITQRGGKMNFDRVSQNLLKEEEAERSHELSELASVARALDIEKDIAVEVNTIHSQASLRKNIHDAEVTFHLEEEFVKKERDIIRKLAGYTSDMSSLLNGPDSSLSLYLFDEYLKEQ